jgi:hypothetical protein
LALARNAHYAQVIARFAEFQPKTGKSDFLPSRHKSKKSQCGRFARLQLANYLQQLPTFADRFVMNAKSIGRDTQSLAMLPNLAVNVLKLRIRHV